MQFEYRWHRRGKVVSKLGYLLAAFLLLANGFAGTNRTDSSTIRVAHAAQVRTEADRELFGMVMRDPFYEYNTDTVKFPNASNRTALERQASELAGAGVKWVRMEFFADYDGSVKAGDINWEKYDW